MNFPLGHKKSQVNGQYIQIPWNWGYIIVTIMIFGTILFDDIDYKSKGPLEENGSFWMNLYEILQCKRWKIFIWWKLKNIHFG